MTEQKRGVPQNWRDLPVHELSAILWVHTFPHGATEYKLAPKYVRALMEEARTEDLGPQIAGHTMETGWFILGGGQGPTIDYIEEYCATVPKVLLDDLVRIHDQGGCTDEVVSRLRSYRDRQGQVRWDFPTAKWEEYAPEIGASDV